MHQIYKRLVSLALAVSLAVSLVIVAPTASAAWTSTDFTLLDELLVRTGSMPYEHLVRMKDRLDPAIKLGSLSFTTAPAEIMYNSAVGAWMLYDPTSMEFYRNSLGRFPYTLPDAEHPEPGTGDTGGTTIVNNNKYYIISAPENTSGTSSNRWRSKADLISSGLLDGTLGYDVKFTYGDLSATAASLPPTNTQTFSLAPLSGGFYGVRKTVSSGAGDYDSWLCNKDGQPFVALKSSKESAANQNYNYYAPVDNSSNINTDVKLDLQVLDSNNKTFSYFEGNHYFQQNIDSLYFDASTKTYHADTYDITYNNDNRVYETNYYTWNITYNITNTYVTYIGSNDAYQQKEYEFYYELPDGRSSADLTADEVAAMSFQFADCINYQRSATDTNLRALYHFDGDLSDSGYFSDKTSFTWQQGASITYMDSSTFNGALYLDETAHKFDVALPSNVWVGDDFTVQFRYYQASQPDTQSNINNSLALGGVTLARWDERNLYPNKSSTAACALPVGNWVELAVVRHSGTVYLYVNGLRVSSWTNNAAMNKVLTFTFGTTSRAYSMVDELRVLDFALVTDGTSYTPTAVPYDSNLVLVLPGEEKVVDSYWNITSEGNLLVNSDFTVGDLNQIAVNSSGNVFSQWCNYYSTSAYGGGFVRDGSVTVTGGSSSSFSHVWCGFQYQLAYVKSSSSGSYSSNFSYASFNKSYVFSVMDDSGSVYSFPFTFESADQSATFDWGSLSFACGVSGDYAGYFLGVYPNPGSSINLIYAEVVPGTSTNLHGEQIFNTYDPATLQPNTAAIQTDIPIHGYTVGGVRPTFPERGDVWMMVEGRRVSSVQVYTGSAWISTNARWWTGERWIPIYAFDIFTLEDCWDIADADDVITPITTDTAGWNWWKKAWTDFRSWLAGVLGSGPGSGSDDDPDNPDSSPTPGPGANSGDDYDDGESDVLDDPLTDEDGKKVSVFSLFKWIGKGLWKLVKGLFKTVFGGIVGLFKAIFDGIGGFFDPFDTGILNFNIGVFSFNNYGGFDIWD